MIDWNLIVFIGYGIFCYLLGVWVGNRHSKQIRRLDNAKEQRQNKNWVGCHNVEVKE